MFVDDVVILLIGGQTNMWSASDTYHISFLHDKNDTMVDYVNIHCMQLDDVVSARKESTCMANMGHLMLVFAFCMTDLSNQELCTNTQLPMLLSKTTECSSRITLPKDRQLMKSSL